MGSTTKAAFFQAREIRFSIPGRSKPILRLSDFALAKGQCLFILGENGAGKTSLLSILGGYLVPDTGIISLQGVAVKPLVHRMVPGFESIELVAQNPAFDPFLTVGENLDKALRPWPEKQAAKRKNYLSRLCRIGPLLAQKTGNLSGGEIRRLSIAVALATDPKLMLLDEPFAELDARSRLELLQILLEIKAEGGVSTIIVSHQPAEARWLADEIRILKSGHWLEHLFPYQGRFIPKRQYSARLLGYANLLEIMLISTLVAENGFRFVHVPSTQITFHSKETSLVMGMGILKASHFDGKLWQSLWECVGQVILVSSIEEPEGATTLLYFEPENLLFLR